MANLLDYVLWRGDIKFDKDSFNAIDACIFSMLTLIDLRDVIQDDYEKITIKDAFKKFSSLGIDLNSKLGLVISNKPKMLFELMSKSKRYKDVLLYKYVYKFDEKTPVQFAALACDISDSETVISFAPTDDSICGWMEDLNMVFGSVESDRLAMDYVDEIISSTDSKIYVVGQSKGGQIASYIGLEYNSEQIKKAYNFDGPGFSDEKYFKEEYQENWKKISIYRPYQSVIGRILKSLGKVHIVKSKANIIFSHDPFEWELIGKSFEAVKNYSDGSEFMKQKIDGLIINAGSDTKMLVDSISKWLYSTEAHTLTELSTSHKTIISLMKMSKEEKKLLDKHIVRYFMRDTTFTRVIVSSVILKTDLHLTHVNEYISNESGK